MSRLIPISFVITSNFGRCMFHSPRLRLQREALHFIFRSSCNNDSPHFRYRIKLNSSFQLMSSSAIALYCFVYYFIVLHCTIWTVVCTSIAYHSLVLSEYFPVEWTATKANHSEARLVVVRTKIGSEAVFPVVHYFLSDCGKSDRVLLVLAIHPFMQTSSCNPIGDSGSIDVLRGFFGNYILLKT